MKNYAVAAWNWFSSKFASIASFAEPLSRNIKTAIKAGDVEKIRAHAVEAREFGQKWIQAADFLDEAIADGNLDLYEGAQALNLLNELADEGEDVVKGFDEDDPK